MTKRFYSEIKDYGETHNGLLKKRVQLFHEAERLAEQLAMARNDIKSLDVALRIVGYTGQLNDIMPKQYRKLEFVKGELLEGIITELKCSERPLTSRELAQNILAASGQDIRDRRTVADLTNRIGRSLYKQRAKGNLLGVLNKKHVIEWQLRP
ncbi:MAG: hypothetical protein COA47_15050 [Robiginitomaculum sp.]|nr:MAG: hypothetical protein COA47_15050 [Robiginitomaculum sp.]